MTAFACPCGQLHEFPLTRPTARGERPALGEMIRRKPFPKATTPDGTWRVPRVWIAAHGLKPGELPALAEKYGWERTA